MCASRSHSLKFFSVMHAHEARRLINVSSIPSRVKGAPRCYSGVWASDHDLVVAWRLFATFSAQDVVVHTSSSSATESRFTFPHWFPAVALVWCGTGRAGLTRRGRMPCETSRRLLITFSLLTVHCRSVHGESISIGAEKKMHVEAVPPPESRASPGDPRQRLADGLLPRPKDISFRDGAPFSFDAGVAVCLVGFGQDSRIARAADRWYPRIQIRACQSQISLNTA